MEESRFWRARLAAPGSGGGLAATIPQGMRASAVKVNDVVGVAGFCHSGDARRCIDHRQSARGSEYWTGIEVLSAGTDIQRDAEGKPQQVQVVNLLVSPNRPNF